MGIAIMTQRKSHKIAGLLLGLTLTFSTQAEMQVLDRIVATVDEDIVLQSEVDERISALKKQYADANLNLPADEVLKTQVLNRLILDNIQLQMGKRGGVRVGDEDLTNTIINIAKQNNLSLPEFQAKLAKEGIKYRAFREQIRHDLIIREVQQHQISRRIYVSPEEVADFLASPAGKNLYSEDYLLGHILIAVSSHASKKEVAEAKAEAEAVYQKLQAGDSFKQLAIEHSDGRQALEGGSLGWKKAVELPSLFAEQASKLEIGETPPPIRSASGFHLIGLLDKKGGEEQQIQQAKVRHILIKPSEIRGEKEVKSLINELHSKLLADEDFGELAREHSDDPGSALLGGDLGWVHNASLVAEFAAQIDASALQKISAPFKTEFGWHILEVLDRRDLNVTQEQLEQKAIQFLSNRHFDEEFDDFLTEIRNDAYVEIR